MITDEIIKNVSNISIEDNANYINPINELKKHNNLSIITLDRFVEKYENEVADFIDSQTLELDEEDDLINKVIARELAFKCLYFNEKYKYGDYNVSDDYIYDILEDYFDNKIQSGQLSPRIFDITYYTKNHVPFIIEEDHFANIDIPEYDAYGLATRFSSKPYLLVSDKSIKDGVDYISNNNRDSNHIKQSQSLIKERMELRRKQRMQKLYQNPSLK